MSAIDGLIARARALGEAGPAEGASSAERERLQRLASEFESMLLNQVLRDMRSAGKWDEEGEDDGFGAQAFFDTIDAELTRQLSRAQGFGLGRQMLEAFDRTNPVARAGAASARTLEDAPVAGAPGGAGQALVMGDPLAAAEVTSGFGWRQDPFGGAAKFHKGIDLRAAYGQEVGAAAGGRVTFSGVQGGYGTTVVVEHANGTRSRYAHLSAALVAEGEVVQEGQPIGRAGNSGRSTGTHLHFEVTDREGRPVNPHAHLDRTR